MLTRQALFAHKLANAEIKGPLYPCEELEVLTRHTDSRLTVVRVAWSLETVLSYNSQQHEVTR